MRDIVEEIRGLVKREKIPAKRGQAPFHFPDSHKRICESGLSGQRHVGDFADVDGLQYVSDFADVDGLEALQAADVLNARRRIARRSRPPQINIPDMPLPDQEKRAKDAQ
ncbi:MAG: hypothetical protein NT010_02485 [Proteobacteria bacterium]|nr:hypothetical protein [Pseudomonadota bacterium]